jgi:hypothetical protein
MRLGGTVSPVPLIPSVVQDRPEFAQNGDTRLIRFTVHGPAGVRTNLPGYGRDGEPGHLFIPKKTMAWMLPKIGGKQSGPAIQRLPMAPRASFRSEKATSIAIDRRAPPQSILRWGLLNRIPMLCPTLEITMFKTLRAALCGLFLMSPCIVSAATLTATWNTDTTGTTFAALNSGLAFTIDFTDIVSASPATLENVLDVFDQDQDGVYEINEITAFSGITFDSVFAPVTRGAIRFVPTISGVSNGTQSAGGNVWHFQTGFTTTLFGINEFTYSLSQINPDPDPGPSPVPLPAGAWLLLAGIGALTLKARRPV